MDGGGVGVRALGSSLSNLPLVLIFALLRESGWSGFDFLFFTCFPFFSSLSSSCIACLALAFSNGVTDLSSTSFAFGFILAIFSVVGFFYDTQLQPNMFTILGTP